MYTYSHFVSDIDCSTPDISILRVAAKHRRAKAFAPGTSANHLVQFATYIHFCISYDLPDINPSVDTITLYVEYLAQRFQSYKSVTNYISGVRLLHKLLGIEAPSLQSFEVHLMLRATRLTMITPPQQKLPITPAILSQLCAACAKLGDFGIILKCAIIFSFFAFLRQSNLAPTKACAFNPRKHTCRGDIIQQERGLLIMLKWTKTIRAGSSPQLIPLPALPHCSPICPLAAYTGMLALVPTQGPNDPLLLLPPTTTDANTPQVITTAQLAAGFGELINSVGLDRQAYSLHSLRRGGASAAYQQGVNAEDLKRHGTWQSEAMWGYISHSPTADSSVPTALAACFPHQPV